MPIRSSLRQSLAADALALATVLRERWAVLLLLAFILTYGICRGTPYLSVPEFSLLDGWIRARPAREPHPDIMLVGIGEAPHVSDQASAPKRIEVSADCTCGVIPRDRLAEGIRRIKRAGAKVTALDLTLDVRCPVRGHDQALIQALAAPGTTIVVGASSPTPDRFNFSQRTPALLREAQPIVASPVMYNPRGIIRAIRLIQGDRVALASVSGPQVFVAATQVWPPLALACYAAYVDKPEELPEEIDVDRVKCAGLEIPVIPSESISVMPPAPTRGEEPTPGMHAMLINWAGPTGTFPMVDFNRVLKADQGELVREFAGRIVLLGSLDERKYTPMGGPAIRAMTPLIDQSQEVSMTGLEIHAQALDTVLQRRFIRPVSSSTTIALTFALVFVSILMFRSLSTAKAGAFLAVASGALALTALQLIMRDRWLYTTVPFTGILIGSITGEVWGYVAAVRRAALLSQEAEARDVATSSLVHDLKQPLVSISCLAQTVRLQQQKGGGDNFSPEILAGILRQVEVALGDIDELLMTDPGRMLNPQYKRFDLAALAHDLAVAQAMKSPVHEVEVHAPEEGVWVYGDPRYLGRAISNLVDNAIKYWPDGGTVVVEVERGTNATIVRVIDHGLGINADQQERIFTRFGRALPEGVEIPGIGIGLFSIKKIMDAHHGSIEVQSEPGKGSVFILTLPDISPDEGITQGGLR